MTIRSRTMIRILVVCLAAVTLVAAHAGYQSMAFTNHLQGLESTTLEDYFREAFPPSLFGDALGNADDRVAIRQRVIAFNEAHWAPPDKTSTELKLAIVRVAGVEVEAQADLSTSPLLISVGYGHGTTDFQLVASRPRLVTPLGWSVAAAFVFAGITLSIMFPHPAPFNLFPLARDLSIVFDRKVSSAHTWGTYRLTHLGGGGQLPDMADNNFAVCNDVTTRKKHFRCVKDTFDRLRPTIMQALPQEVRNIFADSMDAGFCTANARLDKESPVIASPDEVSRLFRPFVRDRVLGFTLLPFEHPDHLTELTGLPIDHITIAPAPSWLIGGYEIYYPRVLLKTVIEEVRSGQLSVAGEAFDRVHVSADPNSLYISVDFIVRDQALTQADINRIGQYIHKPFAGGLQRTADLLQGFGRLLIFDRAVGFDINLRRSESVRDPSALVSRFDFRRIRPEELNAVRALAKRRGVKG